MRQLRRILGNNRPIVMPYSKRFYNSVISPLLPLSQVVTIEKSLEFHGRFFSTTLSNSFVVKDTTVKSKLRVDFFIDDKYMTQMGESIRISDQRIVSPRVYKTELPTPLIKVALASALQQHTNCSFESITVSVLYDTKPTSYTMGIEIRAEDKVSRASSDLVKYFSLELASLTNIKAIKSCNITFLGQEAESNCSDDLREIKKKALGIKNISEDYAKAAASPLTNYLWGAIGVVLLMFVGTSHIVKK